MPQDTWSNRIVGVGEVPPGELIANPRNWRKHSRAQRRALTGVMNDVGWVQRVIVNRGTGHIVDGHLRVELAFERHEDAVPVTYVDLTDEEEGLILATLDPIGALAGTNGTALTELLSQFNSPGLVAVRVLDAATLKRLDEPQVEAGRPRGVVCHLRRHGVPAEVAPRELGCVVEGPDRVVDRHLIVLPPARRPRDERHTNRTKVLILSVPAHALAVPSRRGTSQT